MSFVSVVPAVVGASASQLARIGAALGDANAVAAAPTTGVLAAAEDEVSAAIAALFSSHGQQFQALNAQAAALHSQFVQTMSDASTVYAATEAANAGPLQTLEEDVLGVINAPTNTLSSTLRSRNGRAPTNTLLGRPLIGPGANGTTNGQGVGAPGGAGGILIGTGGNGGNSTATGVPGGAGGPAGLIGKGGTGGTGGWGALGGAGGQGGNGGAGSAFFGGGAVGSGGLGGNAGHLGTVGAGGASGGQATVTLTYTTENNFATVNFSVGGGPMLTTEIDTGSGGLVIPITELSSQTLQNLGPAIGTNVVDYGGWGKFYYTEYSAPVNFGNGIVTAPTTIGVITRVTELEHGVWTDIPQSKWSDPAYAVSANMGVGTGAANDPGLVSPLQALPGSLSQGFLMNEPAAQLQFGPNPLTPVTSVSGGWYSTTLDVQISYDDIQSAIEPVVYDGSGNAIIDSGGLGGYIPHELLPSSLSSYTNGYDLPAGTTISFYNSDGTTLLYTETVTPALYSAGNGPTVSTLSDGASTGFDPFLQGPIYFSYSPANLGTAIWDYAPNS